MISKDVYGKKGMVMISFETHQTLIELLEWYRARDREEFELDTTEEIVEVFVEEVDP